MKQPVWLRTLASLVVVAALVFVCLFVTVALIRLFYPFELEWIEGGNVDEIMRIGEGLPIYGEPSIHFLPFAYAPLFFYVSAAVSKIVGSGFVAPRLVSILCTIGCFVLLFVAAAKESKNFLPGLVACGLYAASYRFTGAWMDLAKTDSMFLFLVLAAYLVGHPARGRAGMVFSGCLFVLAYFTKQMTLPVVLALAPVSLLATRARSWIQWAVAGSLGVLTFLGLDALTQGWFSFYTFDTLTYHDRAGDFWLFWRLAIPKLWPAIVLSALFPAWEIIRWRVSQIRPTEGTWQTLGFCLALVLASWGVFQKVWTYANGLMPAAMGLALSAGLGVDRMLQLADVQARRRACRAVAGSCLCLVLLQFASLRYDPVEQIPTREDRVAGERLIARLRALPGDVLIFDRGYLPFLAGKTTYLHSVAYGDVVGPKKPPTNEDHLRRKDLVRKTFRTAVTEQTFDWIILDDPEASWFPYYIYVDSLFAEPDAFYPVTGARTRPESLLIKNPVAKGGILPLNDPMYDTLLTGEWGVPESWGRLSQGSRSGVLVALEEGDYLIQIGIAQQCPAQMDELVLTVGWNSDPLGSSAVQACSPRTLSFELPKDRIAEGLNSLWFKATQRDVSQDAEPRGTTDRPALGFTEISFERQ